MSLKCPKCNKSYTTRVRIKSSELVCFGCGYTGKLEELNKVNNVKFVSDILLGIRNSKIEPLCIVISSVVIF